MGKENYAEHVSTFIGAGDRFEGTIEFSGTIRIDGFVNGKISSDSGTLIVGDKAVIEGDINVGNAIIRGEIKGMVEAQSRIEISPPANISGDINAPEVAIGTGVVFNGRCNMGSQNESRD